MHGRKGGIQIRRLGPSQTINSTVHKTIEIYRKTIKYASVSYDLTVKTQ